MKVYSDIDLSVISIRVLLLVTFLQATRSFLLSSQLLEWTNWTKSCSDRLISYLSPPNSPNICTLHLIVT
jgi:hypothetical protein